MYERQPGRGCKGACLIFLAGLSSALDLSTDVASVAPLTVSTPAAAEDGGLRVVSPLRVNLRQRVSAVSLRHQVDQRKCDDTACSVGTSLPKMQLSYWEGDAEYDLPFTMDYVIDMAVRATEGDSYTYHPCIIDTGSANLGIAEASCQRCGGAHTSRLSVGYSGQQCIEVLYGDTEADSTFWKGYQSKAVEVGFVSDESGVLTTPVRFAAITDASSGQQAFFQGGYSGILGLGYEGIAEPFTSCANPHKSRPVRAPPLLDLLYRDGKLPDNTFALTFCGTQAPLVLGGVDAGLVSGDIAYVRTHRTYNAFLGYYLTPVTGFAIGGKNSSADVQSFNLYGGLIVDSGTTAVMLPTDVYLDLARTLLATVPALTEDFFLSSTCVKSSVVQQMPSLTLSLSDGVSLTLPPVNYLIHYEGCYYWGVSPSTMAILGNIAMQGLTVVFDRHHHRLGFATATCPSASDGPQVSSPSSSPTSPSLAIHPATLPPTAPSSSSSSLLASPANGLTHRWKSTRAETLPALLALLAEARPPASQGRMSPSPSSPFPPRRLTSLYCMLAGMGVSMLIFAAIYAVQTRRRRRYQPLHADVAQSTPRQSAMTLRV